MPIDTVSREALTLSRVYADAERQALERVAKRIARGIDEPGWYGNKVVELQRLQSELTGDVVKLSKTTPKAVRSTVEEAYRRGQRAAEADLKSYGRPVLKTGFGTVDAAKVAGIVDALDTTVSGTHFRIVRAATDGYQRIIAHVSAVQQTGVITRREAAQQALNRFADQGITGFVDSAGRGWKLQSYVEMAVRTTSAQAALEGHFGRLSENGYDLVVISSHSDSCPLCEPWQGTVVSLSGSTPGYETIADAEAEGLFHPNCGHTFGAYIEGLTKIETPPPTEQVQAAYAERQQQRHNERAVRKWKQREAVAISEPAKAKAAAKVKEKQADMRAFIADTGRRRDYTREQIKRAI